jgi:AP2 domain/HNH endonuclease
MPKLTAERLREVLAYDPLTGEWTWLVDGRGRFMRIGAKAGTAGKGGRRTICIDRVIYASARLAIFWTTGMWPERLIDHRNLNKGDDRWSNLRLANYSQNGANARGRGLLPKGVSLTRNGKFVAQIKINYRRLHLGHFDTAEAAHARYCQAAAEYFGEFARF